MAKQNKTNTTITKPKGDSDFEKELWDVANELRRKGRRGLENAIILN